MQIKEIQNGRHLRPKWLSIQRGSCTKSWRDFDTFCQWAIAHGCGDDRRLKRVDLSKPWGPHNCKIIQVSTTTEDDGFSARWNATVADFRRRLAWADANDPTAITRLLRNGVAVAKKAAPGTGTSESGKANNCTSIIAVGRV